MKLTRMLLLAVAVVTLACVMTLSAFALDTLPDTVVGGNGVIDGLEDGITYQISPVTMKSAKMYDNSYNIKTPQLIADIAEDTWTTITKDSGNSNLAGLYKIKAEGMKDKLVYVKGNASDKYTLGRAATYTRDEIFCSYMVNNTNGTSWAIGRFSFGSATEATNSDTAMSFFGGNHQFYTSSLEGTIYDKFIFDNYDITKGEISPALYILSQENAEGDAKDTTGATRALYAEATERYALNYAMASKEIIPATHFTSMTYKTYHTSSVNMGATKTKVRFYVYDGSNELKIYDAYDDVLTSASNYATTTHTIISSDAKLVTADANLDRNIEYGSQTLADLDANSYVIGFAIHPIAYVDASMGATSNWTLQNVEDKVKTGFSVTLQLDSYIVLADTFEAVSYDLSTGKLSGLEDGLDYYITTYDANGVNYTDAISFKPESDGTYTVPDSYKGLVAVYVTRDPEPFIFWTKSDEMGQFKNAKQSPSYGAVGETGFDLIVPGEFKAPKIPAMPDFQLVNGKNLGFHLRGYTRDGSTTTIDGKTAYNVSGNHEHLFPEIGIYYGFRSTEAFPIEYFQAFDLSTTSSVSACQGDNNTHYITYDGKEIIEVKRAINGNTFQGDLVLYYVNSEGEIGTYTIKGTLQDDITYKNNVYIPTDADVTAFSSLHDCYVIGYALKPYATVNYAPGQTSLFTDYTNNGGYVYVYLSNYIAEGQEETSNTVSFDLLPPFTGTATGKDGKIIVPDSTKNYIISSVTLADEAFTFTFGTGGTESVNAKCADSWTLLDPTAELAGLYKIAESDASGKRTSSHSYVYVNGKVADVQAFDTKVDGANSYVGVKWKVGKWVSVGYNTPHVTINTNVGYITSKSSGDHTGQVSGTAYANIYFIANSDSSPNPALLIQYTEDENDTTDGKKVTKALYAESLGKYSMKYALTAKEIIPTASFNSLAYGLSRVGSIDVGATDTKLQVLVYNAAYGTFSTYEAIASNKTSITMGGYDNPTSKHIITADELTLVGDTTKKLSALGDGNYIMGYEIFPAVNVTEDDIEILNTVTANQFYTYIYYNEYDIDVPAKEIPEFTFEASTNIISGLDANTTTKYYIAPLKLRTDGSKMQCDSTTKMALTTIEDGSADISALNLTAGLWGIGVNGSDYYTDSAYKTIYIPGTDEEKRNLADINTLAGYTVPKPSTTWQQGYWRETVDYVYSLVKGDYYVLTNTGPQLPSMNMSMQGSGSIQDILYQGTNEDEVKAAQQTVMNQVNAHSLKYAYMGREIIPASDFISFTYKSGRRMGNMCFAEKGSNENRNTKLVVYVANSDGSITKYEKTNNVPSMCLDTDGSSDKIVVTASDLLNGTEALSDSNGYIVGIEIYPLIINDASEISASKPVYMPDGATIPYYYNTNFRIDIYYGDYTFKLSPDAPTITLADGGDAITVENYNADFVYEYKAGDDGAWTEFDVTKPLTLFKAGTEYFVRIKDGKYAYTSEASSETSHGFIATGTSLVLGGEIGIRTTFDVADEEAFKALEFYETGETTPLVVEKDANSVTIYVPAKDKTKNFEYRYGNNVIRSVSTVEKYVDEFDSENTSAKALVNALDTYTDYSAVYFGVDGVTADGPFLNDLTSVESSYEYVGPSANITDVEYLGAALILEGKTSIRHYFDGDHDVNYTVKIGEEVKATGQLIYDDENECYYADIADISANNYDVQYTIQVGDSTVTYSVLNYLVNSVKKDKTELVNLVKAMYDYYKAAEAYVPSENN